MPPSPNTDSRPTTVRPTSRWTCPWRILCSTNRCPSSPTAASTNSPRRVSRPVSVLPSAAAATWLPTLTLSPTKRSTTATTNPWTCRTSAINQFRSVRPTKPSTCSTSTPLDRSRRPRTNKSQLKRFALDASFFCSNAFFSTVGG